MAVPDSARRVNVIGTISVEGPDGAATLQPGQRQLVSLLVAVGPGGASTDRLADEVWGEHQPTNWANSLRVAIHRLRKRTGLRIDSTGGGYQLVAAADQVDAWQLLAAAAEDRPWRPELAPLLDSPDCFPGVERSRSILEASRRINAAQRQLIARLAEADDQLQPTFLALLGEHLAAEPFDDGLALAIATILSRRGASAAALGVIQQCRRDRRDGLGAGIRPELDALEQQITAGSASIEPQPPAGHARPVSLQLERYRQPDLVGRDDDLAMLQSTVENGDGAIAVVRGRAGIGKTALLAELAGRTQLDASVVYLPATKVNGIGLAPLTTAVPAFAADIEEVLSDTDHAGWKGALAARFIDALRTQTASQRFLLLVDDAHWLDSQSCELLDHLIRAELGRAVTAVVLTTRIEEPTNTPFREFEGSLDKVGVSYLTLDPLAAADVEAILGIVEPELSFAERHQKAQSLFAASAGIPEVVQRLLHMGLGDGDHDDELRIFDRLVEGLEEPTREVATAAAVMGRRFRLSDVTNLLGTTEEEVFERVDALVGQNLVNETRSFDHFEFSHQLIVDAVLRSMSQGRQARLHLRACELTDDVHATARHLVAAGDHADRTDRAVTFQAVVDSAEARLDKREFWEAAAEFRTAIGLDAGDLTPRAYVSYAKAVTLSGAVRAARSVRERAYAAAIAAEDWDLAVEAACSGLPEAEIPDGEADRLDQLEAIPSSELSADHQLVQALTAARLAAQLGLVDDAREWSATASAVARSDSQRAEAALGERFVRTVDLSPTERLDRLDAVTASLDPPAGLLTRIKQFRAIDQLEIGNLAAAKAEHARFAELAGDNPFRQWQALVLGALLAELRGEWTEADRLATEGNALGHRHGIVLADIVRVAQQFFRLEASGLLGSLVDMIDLIPVSDADSALFTAATTRVLADAGRLEDAVHQAESVAELLLDRPTVTRHGCVALIAPVLANHDAADLRHAAQAALEPFRGNAMVIGIGLGVLPSVEHLWLLLEDCSPAGQHKALEQAIDDCDRSDFLTWSVRYRLDLAALTGSDQAVTEARNLADGTELSGIVPPQS